MDINELKQFEIFKNLNDKEVSLFKERFINEWSSNSNCLNKLSALGHTRLSCPTPFTVILRLKCSPILQ